jgi:hypothetical protein
LFWYFPSEDDPKIDTAGPSGNTNTTTHTNITTPAKYFSHTVTRCGYANVERIAMAKYKASERLQRHPKKIKTSTDFVYYQPALHPKIRKASSMTRGKRPIYQFFIDYE